MLKTASIVLVPALFAMALCAVPAAAQTTAPVEIDGCKTGQTGNVLLQQSTGNFEISFTNNARTTADVVRFKVDLGQERLFIRDVGSFAPGVTITHRFQRRGGNVVSSPLLRPAVLNCSVAAVHFVDGSSWTPASAAAALGVNQAPPLGDGYLGLTLKQAADGVYVALVMPATPAQKAGIRQGDRIASIESNTIQSVADALLLINGSPPGTTLHMTVMRNGQAVNVVATVVKRPGS